MIMPSAATNAVAQNGVGLLNVTRIVCESSLSTLTSLQTPLVTAAVPGSLAYSQVKMQSSAVNGWPSCQVTPRFNFQVTDLPSADKPPFSREGTSAARIGNRLPSASHEPSGS